MDLPEVEFKFGTGAVDDVFDHRDRSYENILAAAPEVQIDWEKGSDIRDTFGIDFKKKNQFSSLSCVGQGWSYKIWALQVAETMNKYGMNLAQLQEHHKDEVDQISAKAIYSQIHLDGGGASIRDGAALLVDWGALFEKQVKSLREDGTTDESFMVNYSWYSPQLERSAKILGAKEYRTIFDCTNMDTFANGILGNFGVVGGVRGSNGRGWLTQFPKPPQPGDTLWGHCLFYGAFGTDEKGKFIATPNSWGDFITEKWKPGSYPGTGWQKLYQDYFTIDFQFNPWLLADKPNQPLTFPDMMKLVKGDNSADVYCVDFVGVLHHIINPHTFVKGRDAQMWGDWGTIEVHPQGEMDVLPKGEELVFTPNA